MAFDTNAKNLQTNLNNLNKLVSEGHIESITKKMVTTVKSAMTRLNNTEKNTSEVLNKAQRELRDSLNKSLAELLTKIESSSIQAVTKTLKKVTDEAFKDPDRTIEQIRGPVIAKIKKMTKDEQKKFLELFERFWQGTFAMGKWGKEAVRELEKMADEIGLGNYMTDEFRQFLRDQHRIIAALNRGRAIKKSDVQIPGQYLRMKQIGTSKTFFPESAAPADKYGRAVEFLDNKLFNAIFSLKTVFGKGIDGNIGIELIETIKKQLAGMLDEYLKNSGDSLYGKLGEGKHTLAVRQGVINELIENWVQFRTGDSKTTDEDLKKFKTEQKHMLDVMSNFYADIGDIEYYSYDKPMSFGLDENGKEIIKHLYHGKSKNYGSFDLMLDSDGLSAPIVRWLDNENQEIPGKQLNIFWSNFLGKFFNDLSDNELRHTKSKVHGYLGQYRNHWTKKSGDAYIDTTNLTTRQNITEVIRRATAEEEAKIDEIKGDATPGSNGINRRLGNIEECCCCAQRNAILFPLLDRYLNVIAGDLHTLSTYVTGSAGLYGNAPDAADVSIEPGGSSGKSKSSYQKKQDSRDWIRGAFKDFIKMLTPVLKSLFPKNQLWDILKLLFFKFGHDHPKLAAAALLAGPPVIGGAAALGGKALFRYLFGGTTAAKVASNAKNGFALKGVVERFKGFNLPKIGFGGVTGKSGTIISDFIEYRNADKSYRVAESKLNKLIKITDKMENRLATTSKHDVFEKVFGNINPKTALRAERREQAWETTKQIQKSRKAALGRAYAEADRAADEMIAAENIKNTIRRRYNPSVSAMGTRVSGSTRGLFNYILNPIGESVNAVSKPVGDMLIKGGAAIGGKGAIGSIIGKGLGKAGGALAGGVLGGPLGLVLVPMIIGAIVGAVKPIGSAIVESVGYFVEPVKAMFTPIVDIGKGLGSALSGVFAFFDACWELGVALGGPIGKVVGSVIGSVLKGIMGIVSFLSSSLLPAFAVLGGVVKVVGAAIGGVGKLIRDITYVIIGIGRTIGDMIRKSPFGRWLSSVGSAISEWWHNAIDTWGARVKTTVEIISGFFDWITEGFKGMISGIKDWIKTNVPWLYEMWKKGGGDKNGGAKGTDAGETDRNTRLGAADANNLADAAVARVAGNTTALGKCLGAVDDVFESTMGFRTGKMSAYQAADVLANNGLFEEKTADYKHDFLNSKNYGSLRNLPRGSVVVWGKGTTAHGHISIADGNGNELSDYVGAQRTSMKRKDGLEYGAPRIFIPKDGTVAQSVSLGTTQQPTTNTSTTQSTQTGQVASSGVQQADDGVRRALLDLAGAAKSKKYKEDARSIVFDPTDVTGSLGCWGVVQMNSTGRMQVH